jgi:hypothetical protein
LSLGHDEFLMDAADRPMILAHNIMEYIDFSYIDDVNT